MSSYVDILAAVLSLFGVVGLLVWLGWCLRTQYLQAERVRLQQQCDLLDAEWQALDNTRRLRETFLQARRAMQRVADNAERGGGA